MDPAISIIIPARNEERKIGACLDALITGIKDGLGVEILVVVNGCTDKTVQVAESRGWCGFLQVLESPTAGKIAALNCGDRHTRAPIRVYLDADVICDPGLVNELAEVVTGEGALYASGQIIIDKPRSWTTGKFRVIWQQLPYVAELPCGCGLYAVNAAGRARWSVFPNVIADDDFVKELFPPYQRRTTRTGYHYSLPEGLSALIKTRARWSKGARELAQLDTESWPSARRAGLRERLAIANQMPVATMVYLMITIAGKLLALISRRRSDWVPHRN